MFKWLKRNKTDHAGRNREEDKVRVELIAEHLSDHESDGTKSEYGWPDALKERIAQDGEIDFDFGTALDEHALDMRERTSFTTISGTTFWKI